MPKNPEQRRNPIIINQFVNNNHFEIEEDSFDHFADTYDDFAKNTTPLQKKIGRKLAQHHLEEYKRTHPNSKGLINDLKEAVRILDSTINASETSDNHNNRFAYHLKNRILFFARAIDTSNEKAIGLTEDVISEWQAISWDLNKEFEDPQKEYGGGYTETKITDIFAYDDAKTKLDRLNQINEDTIKDNKALDEHNKKKNEQISRMKNATKTTDTRKTYEYKDLPEEFRKFSSDMQDNFGKVSYEKGIYNVRDLKKMDNLYKEYATEEKLQMLSANPDPKVATEYADTCVANYVNAKKAYDKHNFIWQWFHKSAGKEVEALRQQAIKVGVSETELAVKLAGDKMTAKQFVNFCMKQDVNLRTYNELNKYSQKFINNSKAQNAMYIYDSRMRTEMEGLGNFKHLNVEEIDKITNSADMYKEEIFDKEVVVVKEVNDPEIGKEQPVNEQINDLNKNQQLEMKENIPE